MCVDLCEFRSKMLYIGKLIDQENRLAGYYLLNNNNSVIPPWHRGVCQRRVRTDVTQRNTLNQGKTPVNITLRNRPDLRKSWPRLEVLPGSPVLLKN